MAAAQVTKSKPQKKWRRQKELMLDISYPEDAKRKWAISKMIQRKNAELEAEEQEIKERGFCSKCHIVKTLGGSCTMGCS